MHDNPEEDVDELDVPPHVDVRHTVRRKVDQAAVDSLGTLSLRVTTIQKALTSVLILGSLLIATLFWLGWKEVSPADAMLALQAQIITIRAEGSQRDTLIHQIARNVALLTYYRCNEENAKALREKRPIIDCIKVYQDGEQ